MESRPAFRSDTRLRPAILTSRRGTEGPVLSEFKALSAEFEHLATHARPVV